MKTLFMALALLSTSVFAQELDATEVLTSILPLGIHQGTNPEGKDCIVSVRTSGRGVVVSASSQGQSFKREVESGSIYRINGARYFLSSDKNSTLMTRAVSEDTQYVVVADSSDKRVECIVDL